MYINYDYYRAFYYVAKYGNLTQAAKIMFVNQPNLTRTIKTLESELGCTLFIRNNRGMKLTPEGLCLFEHIKVACDQIEAGESEIKERCNFGKGSVYVASSEVALHCVLLPALKKYRTLYPEIKLKISNHSTPQALDALKNGVADFAIVTSPVQSSPSIEEITVKKFREVAVCSNAFSELKGTKIGFRELLSYPFISLGRNTASFDLYSKFFEEEGLSYRPETEAATADQILPMVKADLGIGFIAPEFIGNDEEILILDTEKPLPEREICIAKRRDQPLGIAAKELERLILDLPLL